MSKVALIISPNYKDYAKRFLSDCIKSVRAQSFRDFQIYLIDNETSEESFEYLRAAVPEAEIIRLEKNEGFAGGNNAAMKKALDQGSDYILLLNMDAIMEADCLEKLLAAMQANPSAGAMQARLMLWPEKELINSTGNVTHFLGFGYCDSYRKKINEINLSKSAIAYPSGAGVLLRSAVLKKVGLFDEEMWMYSEDQDLGWRIWLSGSQCLLEAGAVIYHKYEFGRSSSKFYWMDRNRIISMIKNYRLPTLLAILPAFIVMEAGLILFSLRSGWFQEKLRVWAYFLSPATWAYLHKARRRSQNLRRLSDRAITRLFSGRIWYQEVDSIALRLINPVFGLYWRVVRLLMFW